jgi:hypothetical protein
MTTRLRPAVAILIVAGGVAMGTAAKHHEMAAATVSPAISNSAEGASPASLTGIRMPDSLRSSNLLGDEADAARFASDSPTAHSILG